MSGCHPHRQRPSLSHPRPTDATVKELYATARAARLNACAVPVVSDTGARVLKPGRAISILVGRTARASNSCDDREDNRKLSETYIVLCLDHASENRRHPWLFPRLEVRLVSRN